MLYFNYLKNDGVSVLYEISTYVPLISFIIPIVQKTVRQT